MNSDVQMPNRHLALASGGWFNIKMTSYQYNKSHCRDKTILRPSYLHNEISYTGKMASLYWIRAQVISNCHFELRLAHFKMIQLCQGDILGPYCDRYIMILHTAQKWHRIPGLCRGCVLGTFSTLKSGMSPMILAVGAHVPTSLRFPNGNIT